MKVRIHDGEISIKPETDFEKDWLSQKFDEPKIMEVQCIEDELNFTTRSKQYFQDIK